MALFYLAGTDSHYFPLMGLFFRRIGDNDPALCYFFFFQPAYEDAVMEWCDIHSHFSSLHIIHFSNTPKMACYNLMRELRTKILQVLLPRQFEVFRFFFLTLRFSLRPPLLVEFHGFGNGKFSFCILPLRIDDEPKTIAEERTDKTEGILRIFPRCVKLFLQVISRVHDGINFRLNTRRRAVLCRDGLHHVLRREPFGGSMLVSHGNLVEVAVREREENLFNAFRPGRSPGRALRPPSKLLNQHWSSLNRFHIRQLLIAKLQNVRQARPKRKTPILGQILCAEHWGD